MECFYFKQQFSSLHGRKLRCKSSYMMLLSQSNLCVLIAKMAKLNNDQLIE